MFPIERRHQIIDFLKENGSITVEGLAQKLDVTPTTIRRDLKFLEERNRITRTFGGAVAKVPLVGEISIMKKTEHCCF
jgi:DeoR/GlpR family transcriptional regulator of sugar metabolism